MQPLNWQLNDVYPDPAIYLNHLPRYIDANSPDPIYRQIEEKSQSGWNPELPSVGWNFTADTYLIYPGLPPVGPAAYAVHLGERIYVYPAGWVVVLQLNGDYTVARVA